MFSLSCILLHIHSDIRIIDIARYPLDEFNMTYVSDFYYSKTSFMYINQNQVQISSKGIIRIDLRCTPKFSINSNFSS